MRCPLFDKIVNKWALQVLYVDLLHFLQAYNIVWTSQTLVFGKVQFFFSGLMAGPTYQPLVRHSNPDAPLIFHIRHSKGKYPILRALFRWYKSSSP